MNCDIKAGPSIRYARFILQLIITLSHKERGPMKTGTRCITRLDPPTLCWVRNPNGYHFNNDKQKGHMRERTRCNIRHVLSMIRRKNYHAREKYWAQLFEVFTYDEDNRPPPYPDQLRPTSCPCPTKLFKRWQRVMGSYMNSLVQSPKTTYDLNRAHTQHVYLIDTRSFGLAGIHML